MAFLPQIPSPPPAMSPYAGGFNYFNPLISGEPNAALGGLLGGNGVGAGAGAGFTAAGGLNAGDALGALANLGGSAAGGEAGAGLGGLATGLGAGGEAAGAAGAAGAGGAAGGLLAGLAPTWPGLGAVALPAGLGMLGKGVIDRVPFIPGSANSPSAKGILGDAAAGAGLGAAISAPIPLLDMGPGAAIGGVLGGIYGLFHHGSNGPSASDVEMNSQQAYNHLMQRLVATGQTGMASGTILDQQVRAAMVAAQDKNGKIDPAAQKKIYDSAIQSIGQTYGQALQQDLARQQMLGNINQFQNAWSTWQHSQPFKDITAKYLTDEKQRNAYLGSLAGQLKGTGAQQYAKYLVGQQMDDAYATTQAQQAQIALAPYQLALMYAGIGNPYAQQQQPTSGSSASSASSRASTAGSGLTGSGSGAGVPAAGATTQNAALLQILASMTGG